jgi:hypothetical protein
MTSSLNTKLLPLELGDPELCLSRAGRQRPPLLDPIIVNAGATRSIGKKRKTEYIIASFLSTRANVSELGLPRHSTLI